MRSILTSFAAVCAVVAPPLAKAADWKPLGLFSSSDWGYIDAASVRKEDFPTRMDKSEMQPYLMAWLKFDADEGVLLEEVAFNCRGGVVSMKQVMSDETPYSRFQSFDNTQAMRNPSFMGGPQPTDIAPDTAYDKAQKTNL
jgi:hypothetical protein